jgi:hypothetical protein
VVGFSSAALVATKVADGVLALVVDPARRWSDDRRGRRRQALTVLHEGTPAILTRVNPYMIGVFESPAAEPYRAAAAARPPYIGRSIDGPLRGAIAGLAAGDGGLVVVKGHPKAGKSRTL